MGAPAPEEALRLETAMIPTALARGRACTGRGDTGQQQECLWVSEAEIKDPLK